MRYAAATLAIDAVIDTEGKDPDEVPVPALIGDDYAALIRLRNEIEDAYAAGTPRYRCPVCREPVFLRCGFRHKTDPRLSKDFHFWHGKKKSNCPLSQKARLTPEAIMAAKYHGQREGAAHIRLKQLIHDSLCEDPRFTDVAMERTWRLEGDPRQWRRPDVSACYLGQPVVFEIQLSTTFVSVMAERRHFYRERGALLVWIVADFNSQWATLAHEDIFYPNNRNMFVANEGTLVASHRAQALMLEAHWLVPKAEAGEIKFDDQDDLVDFGDLTQDVARQRIFHFDTDAAEARIKTVLMDDPLRSAFDRFWKRHLKGASSEAEVHAQNREWQDLRLRVQQRSGVVLPEYPDDLEPILNAIYSVRDGEPGQLVGWGHADLVKLAHHLYVSHKPVLWPYRIALDVYNRAATMRKHDTTGKWRKEKVPTYLAAILRGDPAYRMKEGMRELLSFLFPEMADLLDRPAHEVLEEERERRYNSRLYSLSKGTPHESTDRA